MASMINWRLLAAGILASICIAGTANVAQAQKTAIDLLRECEGRGIGDIPEMGILSCAVYLGGLHEMHALMTSPPLNLATELYCAPALHEVLPVAH